jgi:hypothetical protein
MNMRDYTTIHLDSNKNIAYMYIHILDYYKLSPYFNINRYPTPETLSKMNRHLTTEPLIH